jgi:hypothetical protein
MSLAPHDRPSAASTARVPPRARRLGAAFVAAAVLFQALWLGLPAVFLSLLLLLSYALWLSTSWRVTPRLRRVFALAVLVFVAHVAEEYLGGVQEELPALFGRAAWSGERYLVFNGVWLLVFLTAAVTLRPDRPLPVLVVLFFAVAGGVGNGVLHSLLALGRSEYFPGSWTAVLCLGVGVWLLALLHGSSAEEAPPPRVARRASPREEAGLGGDEV